MSLHVLKDRAKSTLASSISSTDTTITVDSDAPFPTSTPFYLTIEDPDDSTIYEIVEVTGISGSDFTVTRGVLGTSANSWSTGALVELRVISELLRERTDHDVLSNVSAGDHHTKYALTDDLASGEITQLQNINTV